MLTFSQASGFADVTDSGLPEDFEFTDHGLTGAGFSSSRMAPVAGLRMRAHRRSSSAEHGWHAVVRLDNERFCLVESEVDLLALAHWLAVMATGSLSERLRRLIRRHLQLSAEGANILPIAQALKEEDQR